MDMRFASIIAFCSLVLLLAAPPGLADTPAAPVATTSGAVPEALERTLQHLSAPVPVSGTLTIIRKQVVGEGKDARRSQAWVVLDISSTHGISMHLRRAALEQVVHEMKALRADADRPTPAIALLNDTGFLQVAHLLDTGARLELLLDGAKLLQQKQVTLDGRPATLLQFQLPRPHGEGSDRIKEFHDVLSLWLDPQNTPVRYRRELKTRIGWLFFNMASDRDEQGTLEVLDGRLLTRQIDVEETTDALGKHGVVDTTYLLDAHAHAGPATADTAQPASSQP